MKRSLHNTINGIQWGLMQQLNDLDFADDLALMSHGRSQMEEKIDRLNAESSRLGLQIHRGKTKTMRINAANSDPIHLGNIELDDVDEFTYLGSIVDKKGGTDADVKKRIQKARIAFRILNNIWKTSKIRLRTKLKIFNSNVKSVLLYGCETWRTTKSITSKLQTFVNVCLRRILKIKWFDRVRNKEIWERTCQTSIDQEITKRKWKWIGHTLRKPPKSITRAALTWNPQGKRKRGRPRVSWRRDLTEEHIKFGKTWKEVEKLAGDRRGWRGFVGGLCPPWDND